MGILLCWKWVTKWTNLHDGVILCSVFQCVIVLWNSVTSSGGLRFGDTYIIRNKVVPEIRAHDHDQIDYYGMQLVVKWTKILRFFLFFFLALLIWRYEWIVISAEISHLDFCRNWSYMDGNQWFTTVDLNFFIFKMKYLTGQQLYGASRSDPGLLPSAHMPVPTVYLCFLHRSCFLWCFHVF